MRLGLLLLLIVSAELSFAQDTKIGLALSGGGARGAAHIGVLRELERQNISVDYIAGTSMGAIVGALYASGYSVDEIEVILHSIDWEAAFDDEVAREKFSYRRKIDSRRFISSIQIGLDDEGFKLPAGIVSGQSIGLILNRHLAPVSHIQDFDQLDIPFRAVATNLVDGKEEVLDRGSLVEAVTASMSIPGFLIPIERGDKLLVDGGIANNLPVSVVRNMGADIVIAVDISTPLYQRDKINDVVDVADQLSSLLTRKNTLLQIQSLTEHDVLIVPQLDDIATSDFARVADAIPRGEEAAQASEKLTRIASQYAKPSQHNRKENWSKTTNLKVTKIIINNDSNISNERILSKVSLKVGDTFNLKKLEQDIDTIYGMGYFNLVQYALTPTNDGYQVSINIKEKSWGPNYLRVGFNFSTSEDIDSRFNFSSNYLMSNINDYNGELSFDLTFGNDKKFTLDWYQPLDTIWSPFLELEGSFISNQYNFYNENNFAFELSTQSYETDLSLGFEFDNWGEMRVGARYIDGKVEQKVGTPLIDVLDYRDALEYFKVEVDTLDSVYFPQKGFLWRTSYTRSNPSLGALTDYHKNQTQIIKAFEWNHNSITIGMNYQRNKGNLIPLNAYYRSGGLLDFSGYEINQITSQNKANTRATYMRKFMPADYLDLYLGLSYEEGVIWNTDESLDWDNAIEGFSIFVGMDTQLGPLYLGYGQNNDDAKSYYLMLDKLF
ncbi:patatin-like phospholipase family protein [Pleionea litopenaei]|uniref:Patatin-like phospholipase family protein n=1 Tax=Pleionea litopenaei TaxID=3070815 RepID=A0AA51RQN4_9GAMM|nr:patatin-like phospholipase family protein [Pleionea sp. HL-JVS1]WMS85815.1 patatin-like phospholipase family protein [Pleionea sp. HL-JVS1]